MEELHLVTSNEINCILQYHFNFKFHLFSLLSSTCEINFPVVPNQEIQPNQPWNAIDYEYIKPRGGGGGGFPERCSFPGVDSHHRASRASFFSYEWGGDSWSSHSRILVSFRVFTTRTDFFSCQLEGVF